MIKSEDYRNTVKESETARNGEEKEDDDDARRKGELERRTQVVHTWCTVVQEVRFLFIHTTPSFTRESGKEFSTW